MQDLVRHTELHFRTEEGLMSAYGASDLERHRQEHRVLLSDLRSLGAGIEATSVMLSLQHLKAWLVRHIDSLDREFTTELREARPRVVAQRPPRSTDVSARGPPSPPASRCVKRPFARCFLLTCGASGCILLLAIPSLRWKN